MTDKLTTELHRLEEQVREAMKHEADLAQAQRDADLLAHRLETELVALAEAEPEQFDSTGNARPKTDAVKLVAEQRALRKPAAPWGKRLELAAARIREAKKELHAFRSDNLEALAAELEPDARAVVADIEAALRSVIDATRRHTQVGQAFTQLLVSADGLDGSDLPHGEPVSKLARDANHALAEGIRAPLPRSLFPEGREPPKTRTPAGWVPSHYVNDDAKVGI